MSTTGNHLEWAVPGAAVAAIYSSRGAVTSVQRGTITKVLTRDVVVDFPRTGEERWSNQCVGGERYVRIMKGWDGQEAVLAPPEGADVVDAINYIRSVKAGRAVRAAYEAFLASKGSSANLETLDALIAAAQQAREPIARAAQAEAAKAARSWLK
ncbi:hypothetical protein [Rhodococcus qingshengii]|uniref:hypothetical protein n=1 Tax=Rhodococcus qingshengii TaxID=334542 RepID=UPI00287F9A31|nr:hypothetical protein [Rhodococcus qingshengii]